MSGPKRRMIQFLHFCMVGLVNSAVDFTTFFLLTSGEMSDLPSQMISYTAGVVNSFFLNRKVTFRVTHKPTAAEVGKFIIVNAISLLVSAGAIFILYDLNHVNIWMSKMLATGFGIVLNFMGSRFWVFTEKHKPRSEST